MDLLDSIQATMDSLERELIQLDDKEGRLYDPMMNVAKGNVGKEEIAATFRELSTI